MEADFERDFLETTDAIVSKQLAVTDAANHSANHSTKVSNPWIQAYALQ